MVKSGFGELARLPKAVETILSLVHEKGSEEVSLENSLDRILSEDVVSEIDVPHFAKSAMDGYALKAEDSFQASQSKPTKLKIAGSICAGDVFEGCMKAGTAVEITTGAAIPDGADAVSMVENTEREGDTLLVYKPVAPSENIVKIGSDIRKGEAVVRKGARVSPKVMGGISAIGKSSVMVSKRPVIAYFSTGNEILKQGEKLVKGKIYDINSWTVTGSLRRYGADLVNLGLARDDKDAIKKMIIKGLESADAVVFSGGSSLGTEDFMLDALSEIGDVLIHGVAVKPGKPVLVGKAKGKLVLGLPGYPTSTLSSFYILIRPFLAKMTGEKIEDRVVKAVMTRKVVSTPGRYEFLPVKLEKGQAEPILRGSSAITSLVYADGFVEIPENVEVIEKGQSVEVHLI